MEMAGQAIATGAQRQPRPLLASRSGLQAPRGNSHSFHGGCSGLLPLLASTRTNQLLRSQIHAPPGLAQDPWALRTHGQPRHNILLPLLLPANGNSSPWSSNRSRAHCISNPLPTWTSTWQTIQRIGSANLKSICGKESWFQDAAQSNQEANHKLHMVANQVASHQTQLSNLEQAVTQNSTTLQAVNSELREMSRGFGNIEALLNKKLRSS